MHKNKLKKNTKFLNVILVILLVSALVNLLHILFLDSLIPSSTDTTYYFTMLQIIMVVEFSIVTVCTLLIWLTTRVLRKEIHALSSERDNIASAKQRETEFFSNISHELKTPLSVILGAIQLIESSNDSPSKLSKHLHTIRQNCYRLLRIINNILDTTRINSGYIKINFFNCNLVSLIEEMVQSIIPYAEEKNIRVEFDTQLEEVMTAVDIDKIERIMLNLLSNAIKFTPHHGKINVNISSDDNIVKIAVKDTGPGIPQNMQNDIFKRFRQANNQFSLQQEGSGIGLSIVKSFVELHNGSIHLDSKENEGSTFIIELPIQLCENDFNDTAEMQNQQSRIVQAINVEFSDIYHAASLKNKYIIKKHREIDNHVNLSPS